jgi:hypothetical protein
MFWPGRELSRIAARAGEFLHEGIRPVLCASSVVLDRLDDKEVFANEANARGVCAPRSIRFTSLAEFELAYRDIAAMGERVCFKPVRGVFGRGFRVVREDIDPFEDLFEDPGYRVSFDDARRRFSTRSSFRPFVAMPWLDGSEWSVDCFRSSSGQQFVAVPRRKRAGGAQSLEDVPHLVESSRILAEHFGLVGLFNCQFKEHRGMPHVLEINPRPAGGVGLSLHAGVDLVELALRDALGLEVRVQPWQGERTFRPVTRWEVAASEPVETVPTSSPSEASVVGELPSGRLQVTRTAGSWPLPALITVGARRNAARPYLLVSRVLGKHVPVTPSRMREVHVALAASMPSNLPGPVLFVGMGETATGLGWGVLEAWRRRTGRVDAMYAHTTRYPVVGHRALPFEERHSHGPAQVLCLPYAGESANVLRCARTLVVVDDEVTTGLTAAALAAAIATEGVPLVRKLMVSLVAPEYVVEPRGVLEGWDAVQLLSVETRFDGEAAVPGTLAPQGLTPLDRGMGSRGWGRVGAVEAPPVPPDLLARALLACQGQASVYVVGAGECMHPAFLLGSALERRGLLVMVQASTRSPVLPCEGIRASLPLEDGLGSGVPFFLHNPPPGGSRVLALHEPGALGSLRALQEHYAATPVEVWDA